MKSASFWNTTETNYNNSMIVDVSYVAKVFPKLWWIS